MDKQKLFLELYEPIHDKLSRYCLAVTGDDSDAKDLQSETIMKVYEKFDTIKNCDSFIYFLFRVASNINKNRNKRNRFFEKFEDKKFNEIADSNIESSQNADIYFLYKALNRLPVEQRDSIVMYEISGFKTEEIAQLQNCSPEAVRQRLFRGREKLRKLLGVSPKSKVVYSVFDPISAVIISFFTRKRSIPISEVELEHLFELARKTQPVINLNEVALIIKGGAGTTLPPNLKFNFIKHFKNLFMATIFISTIVIVYLAIIPIKTDILPHKTFEQDKNQTELFKIQNQDYSINQNIENNSEPLFASATDKIDNWPGDTIIDGRKFIVYLSNKELEKLGIYKDSVELYYNNVRGMSFAMIGHYFQNHPYKQKTNVQTFYDYFVEYRTDLLPNVKEITMDFSLKFNYQDFYKKNDTLVPVYIKAREVDESFNDFICWFKPTKAFFAVLPDRYKYLQIQFEKVVNFKKIHQSNNDVIYFYPQEQKVVQVNLIENIPTLGLSDEQLSKTGISFDKEGLKIKTSWAENFTYRKDGSYHFEGIKKYPVEIVNEDIYPIQLTDVNGYKLFSWQKYLNTSDSSTINFQKTDLNKLILVKVPSYSKGFKEDLICWFIPTQKLLNSIDGKIGEELRKEYNFLSKQDTKAISSSDCAFFEVCRSTLKLQELKVYPNPAKNLINMEFTTDQQLQGRIVMVNISGQEMMVLENPRTFMAGRHLIKLNVAEIPDGIYLLTIYSDKGFRTQRVMISR